MPKTQQRDDALKKANGVRTARRKLKDRIKDGHDPRPSILDPPRCVQTVPLVDFLMWIPWMGKAKAKRMAAANVPAASLGIQVGDLSPVSRDRVVQSLDLWFAGRGIRYGSRGKVIA